MDMEVAVRNRSRLDLICVPLSPDHETDPSALEQALAEWQGRGLCAPPHISDKLVEGGALGLRLDHPGTRVVYGNQLGGFRVHCPSCGAGMARDFARDMEAARHGGSLASTCSGCGACSSFGDLQIRPPIRVGRCALLFEDVGGPGLTDLGRQLVESVIGPFDVVLRRVS